MKSRASKKQKVFVGVSGGVDSSVSLKLLYDQGYDVTGVFIRTWQPDFVECTWRDERRDAMRVCAHVGVPFLECNLEDEYKRGVADYMISEYRKGNTPNPDVMCNKVVKFGGFLDFAKAHGADFIATGHYAQRETSSGVHTLTVSKDTEKDQTYFLWTLTQDQLAHTLFPVGHLTKKEVRVLAQKYKLPTAQKKDSQGICFLGPIDMKTFLKHYIKEERGLVLNTDGNEIGFHDGALFLTIGERHGFTITKKGVNDTPYYVIAKDVEKNTITVTQDILSLSQKLDGQGDITISQTNWIGKNPTVLSDVMGRIRYRQKLEPCSVREVGEDTYSVKFNTPQTIVASGQSVVFYTDTNCIGGGIVC